MTGKHSGPYNQFDPVDSARVDCARPSVNRAVACQVPRAHSCHRSFVRDLFVQADAAGGEAMMDGADETTPQTAADALVEMEQLLESY